MELLIGFTISFLISIISYKRKSLTFNGAVTAVVLGTGIYFYGRYIPYLIMIIFFLSSSVISKISRTKDSDKIRKIQEKGHCRDYKQVLANGGVAFIAIVLYKITGNNIYFIATIVSFAASTADTWGSEIGVLFDSRVISIVGFKEIKKGLSGGISLIGTLASALGALLISSIFYILDSNKILLNAIIIFIFGFLGSIVDSILGAGLQVKYIDSNNNITEKKVSNNGENNKLIKGISFINNDAVNFISNIIVTFTATLFL